MDVYYFDFDTFEGRGGVLFLIHTCDRMDLCVS